MKVKGLNAVLRNSALFVAPLDLRY